MALVVMVACIMYISYQYLRESFSSAYQQPMEMTQMSGASHIISRSEHVICDNLSHVSISYMRAVSAQWQQLKENVTCYFYSAFWETRITLQEVRVIGINHLDVSKL